MSHSSNSASPQKPWPISGTIATAVGAALLANAVLFLANRHQFQTRMHVHFSPPGWVIGTVWLVLFALMGAAYTRVRQAAPTDRTGRLAILALIILCVLYPLYTNRLRSVSMGIVGDLTVLLLNTALLIRLWHRVRRAALLLLPVEAWLLFALYLLIAQLCAGASA